jgi:hypothetical protein
MIHYSSPFAHPFLILAAGYGSRLEEKTHHVPKCLLPLNSEADTSLSLLLHILKQYNASQIFITGGHGFEILQSKVNEIVSDIGTIELIDARPSFSQGPLYSFLSAEKKLISQPLFWLFPADTLFMPTFFQWLNTQTFIENKIHLFLRPSLISKSHFQELSRTWKEKNSETDVFPFIPYLFPFIGFPGKIYAYAQLCQSAGGKKVVDIFPFINNLPSILQIHRIPENAENFLDLDTLKDLDASHAFLLQNWAEMK